MSGSPVPEPWLRGPVAGVTPLLQPAAHAFLLAREDVERGVESLADGALWVKPGGAASPGFHLLHLSGSTERLLTYARGETLSESQRADLAAERSVPEPPPSVAALLTRWHATVDRALDQLRATPEVGLLEPRLVGRARLPSTVLGLLFHAAEHAERHAGQFVTTVRILAARPDLLDPDAL